MHLLLLDENFTPIKKQNTSECESGTTVISLSLQTINTIDDLPP